MILLNCEKGFSCNTTGFYHGDSSLTVKDGVIKGRVIDEQTGEGLVIATLVKESGFGTVTDLEGYFDIKVDQIPCILSVSYVGYVAQDFEITSLKDSVLIKLVPSPIQLAEIVVKARRRFTKDQYTWYLHKKISENAHINNPNNISPLKYSDYERTSIFYIKKNRKAKKDSSLDSLVYVPFMIDEKVSHISRKNSYEQESKYIVSSESNVLLEDMSSQIQSVLSQKVVVDMNFYEPQLNILGRGFPSPLDKNASLYYRIYVTDSTKIDNRKQYKFQYFPKSKKSTTFKGNFWVDSTTWAITKIDAELPNTANLNFISDFRVSLSYQLTADKKKWFRENQITELNISLTKSQDNSKKFFLFFKLKQINAYNLISDSTVLSKITTQQEKDSLIYIERVNMPMDSVELYAKDELDKLKTKPFILILDRVSKMAVSSYLNAGPIDLGPYYGLYRNTIIEGPRFSLPLRTSEKLFKNFSVGGHLAYGTQNEEFGYGVNIDYRVPTKKRFILSGEFYSDYFDLSHNRYMQFVQENPYNQGTGNFLSSITTIRPNPYMIKREQISATARYDLNSNIGLMIRPSFERFSANSVGKHYIPTIKFNRNGKAFDYFDTQTILMDIRFSKDQVYEEDFFERVYYGTEKPIFHISLLTGRYNLQNEKHGDYFANLNLSAKWKINAGLILFTALLEVGGIVGNVPYPLLDIPKGSGDLGSARFHYNLLDHASMASDLYTHLHLTMNTGGMLFNRIPLINKLDLREIFGFKVYYGALLGNHDSVMEIPTFLHNPTSRPYMEFSAGITNIFKCLRLEYVGGLSNSAIHDGYAFRHGFRMRLEISF